MNQFLVYLLEASICMGLFFALYVLLFRKETFHHLKRGYLLGTLVLSLLIPQLPSHDWNREIGSQILPIEPSQAETPMYKDVFQEVVFGQLPVQNNKMQNANTSEVFTFILFLIYMTGGLYLAFRFFRSLNRIRTLKNKYEQSTFEGCTIVHIPGGLSTFSFCRYIFLSEGMWSPSEEEDVLKHELAHIRQGHSIDLFFTEILKILFWFNPVVWQYKKSLGLVHEYLADSSIIGGEESKIPDYQSLLLRQFLGTMKVEIGHTFNYAQVRSRMQMMGRQKSRCLAKLKLLLALPIFVLGTMSFSNDSFFRTRNITYQTQKKKTKKVPLPWGCIPIPEGSFSMTRNLGSQSETSHIEVDAFWMKETEVRVWKYMEYVEALKESSEDAYRAALPDESKAPFTGYFTDKKYRKYPIVGISVQQAEDFCRWITGEENARFARKGIPEVPAYRLPTETEWIYASFSGQNPEDVSRPAIGPLSETHPGEFTEWGLLNMFDNVSEWTATHADAGMVLVKGNNYLNSAPDEKLFMDGSATYTYVGFRYVRSLSSHELR